ncbi:hypothetical protein MBANPS3_011035 [Mucor bainieri]
MVRNAENAIEFKAENEEVGYGFNESTVQDEIDDAITGASEAIIDDLGVGGPAAAGSFCRFNEESDGDDEDPASADDFSPSIAGPSSTAGPSTAGPSTAGPSNAGPSRAGPSTAGSSSSSFRKSYAVPQQGTKNSGHLAKFNETSERIAEAVSSSLGRTGSSAGGDQAEERMQKLEASMDKMNGGPSISREVQHHESSGDSDTDKDEDHDEQESEDKLEEGDKGKGRHYLLRNCFFGLFLFEKSIFQ